MSAFRFNPLEQLSLDQLRRRTSQKWQAHGGDILPLWVAEMDVLLAPPVAEALHRAVEMGDTGYAANHGYAEAVESFAASRWGWCSFPTGDTRVLADVMTAIVEAVRVSSDVGDAVIVTSPVYAPFFSYIAHCNREVIEVPLTVDHRIDTAAIGAALEEVRKSGRNSLVLIANPHNPTGTVHTRAELEALAEITADLGVRVLADEIHGPLILPGSSFVPFLTVASSENAMTFTSASKGWNLAGAKAALVIAGKLAAADLRRIPTEIDYAPSHLGVLAHTAAFTEGVDWLDDLIAGLDANRSLLGQLLAVHLPAVRWTPPEGTYLGWLDCRALDAPRMEAKTGFAEAIDIEGHARLFFDRAGVAVNSGHIFGSGGAGHVRINFATSQAILTGAVERMGRAIAGS